MHNVRGLWQVLAKNVVSFYPSIPDWHLLEHGIQRQRTLTKMPHKAPNPSLGSVGLLDLGFCADLSQLRDQVRDHALKQPHERRVRE